MILSEDGNYYMFVKDKAVAQVSFESNENFEVICKVNVLVSCYKFLVAKFMEIMLYN